MEETFNKEGERAPGQVTVYTEVTRERAQEILNGALESSIPPRHTPARWHAETVLDFYRPEEFQERKLSRHQPIFTSHVPYQAAKPVEGRVLLAMEVDPEEVYIAEGEYITDIMFGFRPDKVMKLKEIAGTGQREMTREEFAEKWVKLSAEERNTLTTVVQEPAQQYWQSISKYSDYLKEHLEYEEPEVLLIEGARISNIREAGK